MTTRPPADGSEPGSQPGSYSDGATEGAADVGAPPILPPLAASIPSPPPRPDADIPPPPGHPDAATWGWDPPTPGTVAARPPADPGPATWGWDAPTPTPTSAPAGFPAPGDVPPPVTAPGGHHRAPPPPFRSTRRSSGRLPLVIGAVVLTAVVVVAAVVLLREGEPDLQWQGEGIDEPEATLEDAERALDALVDERHGALHDDGRCYFSLPEDEEVKDVNEYVRCGPVLFVDGDPDAPYLSFPLTLSGEGDTTLVVGDRPVSPEPTALDPGERLSRPDRAQAPDGNGGLEAPEPPAAAEDLLGAIDIGGAPLEEPTPAARIGSLNASYELTSLGTIDRYGRGDDARRPAEGHELIAFRVATGPGEQETPSATPTVQVQVDDGERRDVGSLLDGDAPVVMSVPDDAASVDLVVTDADVEQRLSLLDGTLGEGNLQVLARSNRTQTLGTAHQVSVTGRDANGSAAVTGTITVQAVYLDWFLYADPSKRPSTPQTAFLVVLLDYAWVGVEPADAGLTDQPFSLALPDGQVLPATNLAADPQSEAIIAIEVPADFTTGTMQIGGVDQQPTGLTVDFGGSVYSTPISIPAG